MNTLDEFVTMMRDQIGLELTVELTSRGFDEVPGWDSVHLLGLVSAMEKRTGRSVPLPDILEASSLEDIFNLYVGV
ncbi:acyl carrier protein [Haloactinomyces albus]|uniref:Acyl carrier protein n=1 Tax=Haloactinomyces albus TaxID=1352928 RepID=A0AAE3ZI70_9ACTN|nr:phosphopantetheine-binding protein [Haloactinomyces albus]MDR7303667.1 acyl carrier protein [Haloactinomyces albus]